MSKKLTIEEVNLRLKNTNLVLVGNYITYDTKVEFRCYCGNIFFGRLSDIVSKKTVSCGCRKRENAKKKINPNKKIDYIRKSSEYKNWAKEVKKKNDNTCYYCGIKTKTVESHHLDGFNWCKEKRFDINNGICLCNQCHKTFHKLYGYGNNTIEQFDDSMSIPKSPSMINIELK